MSRECTIVVPYFNESARFDPAPVTTLVTKGEADVIVVDDGSTDGTGDLLSELARRHPDHVSVLSLGSNRGKAEAVRRGLDAAVADGAALVGYCDGDFAAPPHEVARLVQVLRTDVTLDAVIGSRVAMMGVDVRRSAFRHYTGRLFATAASAVLGEAVYDTQCGAKVFRVTDNLRVALATPFVSRWAFDVELIGRLLPMRCRELPLQTWHDRDGSHMSISARLLAAADLIRIARRLPRRERQRRHAPSSDGFEEQGDGA